MLVPCRGASGWAPQGSGVSAPTCSQGGSQPCAHRERLSGAEGTQAEASWSGEGPGGRSEDRLASPHPLPQPPNRGRVRNRPHQEFKPPRFIYSDIISLQVLLPFPLHLSGRQKRGIVPAFCRATSEPSRRDSQLWDSDILVSIFRR